MRILACMIGVFLAIPMELQPQAGSLCVQLAESVLRHLDLPCVLKHKPGPGCGPYRQASAGQSGAPLRKTPARQAWETGIADRTQALPALS